MKNWGHNTKALILYRSIKRLQKTMLDSLKKQGVFVKFEKDLVTLLKKEKLDPETFEFLKLLMGKERSMTMDEQIGRAVDKALEKQNQFVHQLKSHRIPLVLTRNGDLYREPKEKLCYPMRGDAKRLKLLHALIGYSIFRPPKEIIKEISATSYASLTEAKRAINRKAHNLIGLPDGKENNLIISKSYSGYMINPLYSITQED